jgi:hypothetical protein
MWELIGGKKNFEFFFPIIPKEEEICNTRYWKFFSSQNQLNNLKIIVAFICRPFYIIFRIILLIIQQ